MEKLFKKSSLSASNISEWLEKRLLPSENTTEHSFIPLIDLRPYEDYQKIRIKNTRKKITIISLPLLSILDGSRSCELPPRNVSFGVIIPANAFKTENSPTKLLIREDIHEFFFSHENSKGKIKIRWNIQIILLDTPDFWKEAKDKDLLCTLPEDKIFPLSRLWQPDELVQNDILSILLKNSPSPSPLPPSLTKTEEINSSPLLNEPKRRFIRVFDLGCGASRDVCFLAEEFKSYHLTNQTNNDAYIADDIKFIGIDRHKVSKDRSLLLWKNRNVHDITNWLYMDLNKVHLFHQELIKEISSTRENKEMEELVLIYIVRFISIRIIEYIATSPSCLLKRNTIFAMTHFCFPTDDCKEWNYEHPKISNVLKRSQMRDLFTQSGNWNIIKDEITTNDKDYRRPMLHFIAQRL